MNFDAKAKTDDGRFVVKDTYLTVTVPKKGRTIQMLYSDREIKGDFDMKVLFRASPNSDSGLFIRGRQLQVRDYLNAGPYKHLKRFKEGDWNVLLVLVRGDTARCTCNGETLEESFKVPPSGPIGIEADRGKIEFGDITIKTKSLAPIKQATRALTLAPWELQLHGDAESSMSSTKDTVVINTTKIGEKVWHAQLFHPKLELEEGAFYKVSFDIKSDTGKGNALVQAMINEPDWHEVGLHQKIELSKQFVRHEFKFKATQTSKGKNRIGLVVGYQIAKITVRDFVLKKFK